MNAARPAGLALGLLVALAVSGCAALFRAYDVAPNGLSRHDDALRHMLARGDGVAALVALGADGGVAHGDALLRDLQFGIAAHHAGRYADSNVHLHRAVDLADERAAISVSRTALSYISSDRILHFEPSRTERLLIPYVAALNFLKLGDMQGALVEARRLAFALQRADDAGGGDDAELRAMLREFTGTIFAAAGETNDADVAFRNAVAMGRNVAPHALQPGEGFVVLVVEHGFVAHRVETSLNVMLHPDEAEIFGTGDTGDRLALAGLVAARVLDHATHSHFFDARHGFDTRALVVPAPREPALVRPCVDDACSDDSARRRGRGKPYLLRLAWPAFRQAARAPAEARLVPTAGTLRFAEDGSRAFRAEDGNGSAGSGPASAHMPADSAALPVRSTAVSDDTDPARLPGIRFADVSRAVVGDFERERTRVLARTIVRGAAKLAITHGAERKVAERDDAAGRLVGMLGNVGSALLEQADTRSWNLLPGGIGLLRIALPEGTHDLGVEVAPGRRIELGAVEVAAGRTTFLSARAW